MDRRPRSHRRARNRRVRHTTEALLAFVAAAGLLAGCGASSTTAADDTTTSTDYEASISTIDTTTSVADEITTTTTLPDNGERDISALPVAASIDSTYVTGDAIHGEWRIAEPIPGSEAPSAVVDCLNERYNNVGPERDVVVHLQLTVTLKSALAIDLFANLHGDVGSDTGVLAFRNGEPDDCGQGASIQFNQLQPNQPRAWHVWLLYPNVITPNSPTIDRATFERKTARSELLFPPAEAGQTGRTDAVWVGPNVCGPLLRVAQPAAGCDAGS